MNLGPYEAKNTDCLSDLRSTDPRDDIARIEASKDKLLKDSCAWILEDRDFLRWKDSKDTRRLWIRGGPGKGKTMMMIALVGELSRQLETNPGSGILSYFFCQNTDVDLNNAVSILRGLIYVLVDKDRALIRHLRKKYDVAGRELFEDKNAFYALQHILSDILDDPSLECVYLMIDALDECESQLSELLDLIARTSKSSSRVKWLVSSRNRADIEKQLNPDGPHLLSLELNSSRISDAVNAFINFKVSKLAEDHDYDSEVIKEVSSYLRSNAGETFLWVALVCKQLERVQAWDTQQVLKEFPPGLEPLYARMMKNIRRERPTTVQYCSKILSTATMVYRPLHLKELAVTAGLPEQLCRNIRSVEKLVDLCGSFLAIREGVIYFVHQSAKDYFSNGKVSEIFPSGQAEEHCKITSRSLQAMSATLKRDICSLQKPGALLDELSGVNQDPLAHIRYACRYWVAHCDTGNLQHNQVLLRDGGEVHVFLQEHFLHWLEALSLMGNIFDGAGMMRSLEILLTVSNDTVLQSY